MNQCIGIFFPVLRALIEFRYALQTLTRKIEHKNNIEYLLARLVVALAESR